MNSNNNFLSSLGIVKHTESWSKRNLSEALHSDSFIRNNDENDQYHKIVSWKKDVKYTKGNFLCILFKVYCFW